MADRDPEVEAEQQLRKMLSEMKASGASDQEILEAVFQANQMFEQQTPKRTKDPMAALASNVQESEDGYVSTETFPIATGNSDENGRPIELDVTVEEPPNVEALLTAIVPAFLRKGDEWKEAKESILATVVVEPEALTKFSRLMSDDELEKYHDEDNEDYPKEHLDFFWKCTPSFRTNLMQRVLPWLGLNEAFLRDFVRMSTGGTAGQQMSSMLSPERIRSILSDLNENSEIPTDSGQEQTSSASTKPSTGKSKRGAQSGSKTTSGSSATLSPGPSEEKTQSSSPTQTQGSELKPIKQSEE